MSLFTRQHYVWLASHLRDEIRAVKKTNNVDKELAIHDMIARLASALSGQSDGFDTEKFFNNIYNPLHLQGDAELDEARRLRTLANQINHH